MNHNDLIMASRFTASPSNDITAPAYTKSATLSLCANADTAIAGLDRMRPPTKAERDLAVLSQAVANAEAAAELIANEFAAKAFEEAEAIVRLRYEETFLANQAILAADRAVGANFLANQATLAADREVGAIVRLRAALKPSQSYCRWTPEEHQAFLVGLKECGREWKKVTSRIPTRTHAQVRSHAQNYFKRKSTSVSSTDITTPAITPSPAKKIKNNEENPRQSQRLSASAIVEGTAPQHRPTRAHIVASADWAAVAVGTEDNDPFQVTGGQYFDIFERKINKKQKKRPPTASPATSNVIAGPKTTVEDEDGGNTLTYSLKPTQLGPDELCATVITIDNGPNAEEYTIEFGAELLKILVLKEEDKKRSKHSKLWSFVELMSNKNDGSYISVNLQTGSAIAFMEDPSRQSDHQQFPKLYNTIKVYNDELAPLCISSKMNIMATSKSATGFHGDHPTDKEGLPKQDRLIHCINIGKKLAFKMTRSTYEYPVVCRTNTQHHIVSGKHCTYCNKKFAQHKGSNTDEGIVLSVVADPNPDGKL